MEDQLLTDFMKPCDFCPFACCKLCVARIVAIVKSGPNESRLLFRCPQCRSTSVLHDQAHAMIFRSVKCLGCIVNNCKIF